MVVGGWRVAEAVRVMPIGELISYDARRGRLATHLKSPLYPSSWDAATTHRATLKSNGNSLPSEKCITRSSSEELPILTKQNVSRFAQSRQGNLDYSQRLCLQPV